jgi:sphingolipid 8-(E)-desaturase
MSTAYDAGHRSITHIFAADTLIGMFIVNFCCGPSIGWWKSSHNLHYLITNDPTALPPHKTPKKSLMLTTQQEHDPDIQNVPLLIRCPSKPIHSTCYDFTFA